MKAFATLIPRTVLASTTAFMICIAPSAFSQVTYPYVIPGPVTAALDVNTSIRVPIDHMQLCVNYDPYDSVSLQGFNHPTNKTHFRTINPPGVRWPQGVWANFYDWESDGRRIFDNYQDTYYGAVVNVPQLKYGFDGLHELHDELNFDVLFTWNVMYDSVEKGMARYHDRISKGFDFRWIELGNENFYKDQRSDAILDPINYPPIARAHSQALKAADPNIMISVPAAWKTFPIPLSFTNAVAADQSYYDAVSLHKYMSGNLLDASAEMQGAVDYIKSVYPGKPIWLTEWAVNGSGDNALGALGTAEIYLYFFNRMDQITMNQNFQVFGGGNFYDSSFNKTSFGASYDIIRSVFADSEMFASTCTSTEIAGGINAVHAEAVIKDGERVVFALNKADKAATFALKFDGVEYTAPVKHEALAFNDANEFKLFGFTENPLSIISQATTTIILPPLSMNVISGIAPLPAITAAIEIEAESAAGQPNLPPFVVATELGGPTCLVVPNGTGSANFDQVASNQGIASYSFEVLEAGAVTLEVLARVPVGADDSFWHRINSGNWVKHDFQSGNSWKWIALDREVPLTAGMHTFEIARREDGAKLDRFRLTSTDGTFADSRVTLVQQTGTTRIEAEDYDQGGAGVGYLDRTPGNAGGQYRADDVDIEICTDTGGGHQVASVQTGEWLRYPIKVQTSGTYQFTLRAACTHPGGSTFRVLIDHENASGTLVIPNTGSPESWTNVVTTLQLAAGKHQLRLKFTGDNVALNYIELNQVGAPLTLSAHAGPDQIRLDADVDGFETFLLDSSGSTASDGYPITEYRWNRGSKLLATGPQASVELTLGTHLITLIVADSSGATRSDLVSVTVEPPVKSDDSIHILAGWETWSNASGVSASQMSGVDGIATKSGWAAEFRAASGDGTFGSFAGADPTTGSDATFHHTGTRYANMTAASIDFTITDTTGIATDLSGFHFDAVRRGATAEWTLEVISGAITAGIVSSGTVDNSFAVNILSNYDIELAGLADSTLDAYGTATFRLSFASGTAKHLELDNVGISGSRIAYPDGDNNGLPDYWEIYYLGGTGQVGSEDSDQDGHTNGAERVAGTDPGDASSRFELHGFDKEPGGGFTAKWDSTSGRTYTALKSDTLNGGWTAVSGPLAGTGGELSFIDLNSATNRLFYKVQVTMP